MLNAIKDRARRGVRPVAALLLRLGLTANQLTISGFLLNLAVGLVIGAGYQLAGGLLLLFAGLFDTLDGAVARLSGRVTVFGGFLDSTLDRYSEAAIFFGLLMLYTREGRATEVYLVYAVIVGSLMVSYARARAEGLGLRCDVGWLQRPERLLFDRAGSAAESGRAGAVAASRVHQLHRRPADRPRLPCDAVEQDLA